MDEALRKRVLLVIDQPPHAGLAARERLDQVLMALAFDQDVQVVFVGDGAWQLLAGQQADSGTAGSFTAGYKSLSLYGISGIWVESEALEERGISPDDLLLPVGILTSAEVCALIHSVELLL